MSRFYEDYWKEKGSDTLSDFSYKWPAIRPFFTKLDKLKILDFGCGAGKLLEKIYHLSPNNKYSGVDVSKNALKRAKKRLPQAKFVHLKENIRLPFVNEYFDYIIATDVIEHIYETKETMRELNRVLKRGGKILITTPFHGTVKNIIISLIGFEKVFDPTGPHIRFFTPNFLKKLLKETGFITLKVGYFGRFYPLSKAFYIEAKKHKFI